MYSVAGVSFWRLLLIAYLDSELGIALRGLLFANHLVPTADGGGQGPVLTHQFIIC